MTTSAATWFYRAPEKAPFLLAERVRTTFWDARFGDFWVDAVSTESPIRMEGIYSGQAIQFDWEPGKWFKLSTNAVSKALLEGTNLVLGLKAVLKYEDSGGQLVWEWWVNPDELEKRWKEIQGKPSYNNPLRLDRNN